MGHGGWEDIVCGCGLVRQVSMVYVVDILMMGVDLHIDRSAGHMTCVTLCHSSFVAQ